MPDLRGAIEGLLDAFEGEVPEANCSCHLSAPCGDCVGWRHQRDAIAYARGQLQQGDAPFAAAPPAPVVAEPPAPPKPKCPRCHAHTALVCGSPVCGNRPAELPGFPVNQADEE